MKKNWTRRRIAEHALFWIIYAFVSATAEGIYDMRMGRVVGSILIELPPTLIAVYSIVYYVVPNLFQTGKYARAILLAASIAIVSVFVDRLIVYYVTYPMFYSDDYSLTFFNWHRISQYIIQLFELVGIVMGIKYFREWMAEYKKSQAIAEERRVMELNFLRAQVQPHFLFNTLNSIYNEILKQSPKAPKLMIQLSNLLRYILYECQVSQIDITKEIKVINDYIALETSRIGERLKLSFNIIGEEEFGHAQVPPMAFLSLVENAFKHGAAESPGESEIRIDVRIDQSNAFISVENSLSPIKGVSNMNGIGLNNLKRQLQLMYGDAHYLNTSNGSNTFRSELSIPTASEYSTI